MSVYAQSPQVDGFGESRRLVEELISWLADADSEALAHAELEEQLSVRGRQLQRQLAQDHFDLRAVRERRLPAVAGHDGVMRIHAEAGHRRVLATWCSAR